MTSQEDRDLVIGLQANDAKYQHLLVEQYAGRLLPFVMQYGLSRENASEVVNDTFYKVVKNIDKFDFNKNTKLSTWIAAIAKNTAKDKLKQLKNKHTASIEDLEEKGIHPTEALWMDSQSSDTESGLLAKKLLKEALSRLSETDQTILMERARGFEHKKIGAWLNKKENAVKVAHHRALIRLKQKFIELIESLEQKPAAELNAFLGIEDANEKTAN